MALAATWKLMSMVMPPDRSSQKIAGVSGNATVPHLRQQLLGYGLLQAAQHERAQDLRVQRVRISATPVPKATQPTLPAALDAVHAQLLPALMGCHSNELLV